MTGIVNVTGARSGIIGTTSGAVTVSQSMTLLHATNADLSGSSSHIIGSGARGVGTGASGSGYLFQTDYFYYKVYAGGLQFTNGYPGMRGVDTSNNFLTANTYNHVSQVIDSTGTSHHQSNEGRTDVPLSQRTDNASGHRGPAGTDDTDCGNTMLEITFFNPAGPTFTGYSFVHTQVMDTDGDLRSCYGSGHYETAVAWGGFEMNSQAATTFNGYFNIAVYGLTSQPYDS